jgi:hypothetical protein
MADLNEAYNMLTPSVYDKRNKVAIQQISDEHRKPIVQPLIQPPVPTPTNWWTRLCNNVTYLFCCCTTAQPDEDDVQVPVSSLVSVSVSVHAPEPIDDPLGFKNDDGYGKIPQDTAEARMNAMIAERNRQDNLYFPQTDEARAKAKVSFDEFNRVRNAEVDAQFKQMQRERGY